MNLSKLPDVIADKLLRAGLTNPTRILKLTENELQKVGDFTREDVKNILFSASESIVAIDHTFVEPKCITMGCEIIDSVLGGGLWTSSGINELAGESGCGKTQFCLRLALTAQNAACARGIDKAVLYICTEDNFPSKRLSQLINNIRPPFKNAKELPYGDRIYVEHIADVKGLKDCLMSRLPKLLITSPIGLIIIDSITAVFRADYTLSDGAKRTKDLRSIGCQLHSLARKNNLCVLCVNQVTAIMNNASSSVPALGLAWANLVTTRIIMKKSIHQDIKSIELIFSPHHKPSSCNYIINEFGIQGLSQ